MNSFEICKIIKSLEPKTSKDPFDFTAKFIKSICDYIAHPISLLINCSLQTGIFPTKLKIGKIIPIFKRGDEELFDNYRPISLLPVFSKVYEKVVHNQLYHYFCENLLFF